MRLPIKMWPHQYQQQALYVAPQTAAFPQPTTFHWNYALPQEQLTANLVSNTIN